LKKRTKKLLNVAGGDSGQCRLMMAETNKSFLALFFKKELLPS